MVNRPDYVRCFLVLFVVWLGSQSIICRNEAQDGTMAESKKVLVDVGVVLDLNTRMGAMADVSMSMALVDFYAMHPSYKTRLVLHTRDVEEEDILGATSAVTDLLKMVGVHTIIGPQTTDQVGCVIDLASKSHVPIISFSSRSTCLSGDKSHHHYFIRTSQNDSSQVNAITALFQGFDWHRVVFIYEETGYCNGIIPHLTDAFQEIDVRVAYKKAIPTSAKDFQIMRELKRIMAMQTRVILVHMTTTQLGSRLFKMASRASMMREGYAWLITDGLSNSLDEMDPLVIDSMEGVLGLRPHIPKSIQLEIFQLKWNTVLFPAMKPNSRATELNIFGLWAYDTVWALATAVERIGRVETGFTIIKDGKKNATEMENIGISKIGSKILREMKLNTKFKGLSGEFQLLGGNLQPSIFEILNVVGKGERVIGYWKPDMGIYPTLDFSGKPPPSSATVQLKKIIWPGDSFQKPVDGVTPAIKKKLLKVGIPVKKGLTKFVKRGNYKSRKMGEANFKFQK